MKTMLKIKVCPTATMRMDLLSVKIVEWLYEVNGIVTPVVMIAMLILREKSGVQIVILNSGIIYN